MLRVAHLAVDCYTGVPLLRVTRKRSCTSAGNAQAQLHFRDDQQRASGISNISN